MMLCSAVKATLKEEEEGEDSKSDSISQEVVIRMMSPAYVEVP